MADPIIELRDASVRVGDAWALDSLTLTIREGEHAAILGPNGAGKSTLIKLLTLEHYPAVRNGAAPIRIFGRDRWDLFELRAQLGIVSADVHDRFVHGNCRGALSALDAVVSGFFGTQGVFAYQDVTPAMRSRAGEALELLGVAAP